MSNEIIVALMCIWVCLWLLIIYLVVYKCVSCIWRDYQRGGLICLFIPSIVTIIIIVWAGTLSIWGLTTDQYSSLIKESLYAYQVKETLASDDISGIFRNSIESEIDALANDKTKKFDRVAIQFHLKFSLDGLLFPFSVIDGEYSNVLNSTISVQANTNTVVLSSKPSISIENGECIYCIDNYKFASHETDILAVLSILDYKECTISYAEDSIDADGVIQDYEVISIIKEE